MNQNKHYIKKSAHTFPRQSVKVVNNQQLTTQPANTCLKLLIETVEQGVKYIQS